MAPGRPPLAHQGAGHVAQPHGGDGSFEIDPAQVGLARGGGSPLPPAVLAKMEAAFGADFSAVRIHVGPQASRIGAVAFTMGNDLYFTPGRYQPESIQGLQLIGHELAHVVQQRSGRVRSPGPGVAVVQDRALEAEADRLGMRAAMQAASPPLRSVQRRAVAQAKPACGCSGGSDDCDSLPPAIRSRIGALARSGSMVQSQQAFARALPGLVSQVKLQRRQERPGGASGMCDCGGACGCGGTKDLGRSPTNRAIQSKSVIQAANCTRNVNGVAVTRAWYTRTGAQVRQAIAYHHNMNIDAAIAHTLCCAFCEAQIRTLAEGGGGAGNAFARYTALFEHYVHDYRRVGENVFTEEVYWIPGNVANFAVAIGIAAQPAFLYDNNLWGQIRGQLLALIAGLVAPLAPVGLAVANHAAFAVHVAALNLEAVPAAPVVGRRRSYSGAFVRNSALYAFLRFISNTAPAIAAPSEWHQFRDLSGRVRILDFTGESAGGQAAVVDAKFSYGATFDNFGPGQAADQLAVHQSLAAGPGLANSVPPVTWHLCGCSQDMVKQLQFDQKLKKLSQASGKRNEGERKRRAEEEYESASKRTRFISSADVKWIS